MPATRITEIEVELQDLHLRRHALLLELDTLRRNKMDEPRLALDEPVPKSVPEKIAFFLALFGARRSVYPQLWENAKTGRKGYSPVCRNEWMPGVCEKPEIKCSECRCQDFSALDAAVFEADLTGRRTIGTYAIREDDSCIFLAADFDATGWQQDAVAYRDAALEFGIHTALERSRSGDGAHAWIFFAQPVPAQWARRLGTMIVAKASARHLGKKTQHV